MSNLLALADRVEKLTGPDRRVDAEIDCAVRFRALRPARIEDHKEHQRGFPPVDGDIWCPTGFLMAASYTRSLDDALTLVPEGMEWLVRSASHLAVGNKDQCYANVGNQSGEAHADTGSCALCAAALRAIANTGSAT